MKGRKEGRKEGRERSKKEGRKEGRERSRKEGSNSKQEERKEFSPSNLNTSVLSGIKVVKEKTRREENTTREGMCHERKEGIRGGWKELKKE